MTYFYKEGYTGFTLADATRCTLVGYVGEVYKITDKVEGSGHAEEFITKHNLETKTTSQAQSLVNDGITAHNTFNEGGILGGGTVTHGSVTLE